MIDRRYIGKDYPPLTVEVEKGQLKFFAKATGETNPVYFDETAARAAGYRALPAPPTFAFSLGMATPEAFDWLTELGVDLGKVLHGQQQFEYGNTPILAGDTITLRTRIADIYDKKNGAMEFIVRHTRLDNQHGECVGTMSSHIIVRHR